MSVESDFIRGNTPAMVLSVLRDAPSYGYAIAKEINRRSGHLLRLRQGTLYPALRALEEKGWIVGEWTVGEGSRPRRVYTISEEGSRELIEMVVAWRALTGALNGVFDGDAPSGLPPVGHRNATAT